jgi:thiol-disulfide isomerase/thioredoxin
MFNLSSGKAVVSAMLLFCSMFANARNLIVTVAGTHQKQQDTFFLTSDNELTGIRMFEFKVPVIPGKITSYHFKSDTVRLFRLDKTYFLTAANDSIAVAYDEAAKSYHIIGGRYPANYSIFEAVKSVKTPFTSYIKAADNYNDYVQQVDSATTIKYKLLEQAADKGSISPDVYDYAKNFIRHMHLYGLLYYRSSPAFRQQFPKSPGRYVSAFSLSDFQHTDQGAPMVQTLAAASYVITQARLIDSSNFREYALDNVISNFTGTTRALLLRTLIVNFGFGEFLEKNKFQALMNRIQELKLPEEYFGAIRTTYMKRMIDGQPIDSLVMAGSKLRTINGKIISFKELQQQSGGKEILIDFWASWCSPCIASFPALAKLEKDYTIFYISLDTDVNKWKTAAAKHLPGKQPFLLIDNYQSPLALYFLVSSIPRQVILDKAGIVRKVDHRVQ